jgi:hypothetical protein
MHARHHQATETLEGEFQYPIYSPKGTIEGALLHVADAPLQLVFEPHDSPGADAFAHLQKGEAVSVVARAKAPSDKGTAAHAVYSFERLASVNGRKPAKPADAAATVFDGTVVRLNFARHGEANGVVLDSGHFIHMRPDGMATLKLAVGDRVEARGEARMLVTGDGQVVDANTVNGRSMGKPRPKAS